MSSGQTEIDIVWSRRWSFGYWIVAGAVALALGVAGLMRPWMMPDTAGYLHPCTEGCLAGPRTPFFGWFANSIFAIDPSYAALPWIHFLAWAGATWALMAALRSRDVGAPTVMAVGCAVLGSNMVLLWGRAVLPESLAHAAVIGAYAAAIARGTDMARVLTAASLAGAAYLFKPGLAACVAVLPILVCAVEAGTARRRIRLAGLVLAAALIPFLAVSSLRLAIHGSFNVVSFSGFQMAGMSAMMLTPAGIARMPAAEAVDAAAILTNRDAAVASGIAMPIPPNSTGVRSFHSVALQYFDVLARNHDAILYGPVMEVRRADESWVAFDRRMQLMSLATIVAERTSYVAWLVGALSRLVGHMLMLNGIFVVSCSAWAGWSTICLLRGIGLQDRPLLVRRDVVLLAWLSLAHAVAVGLPAVALTFPAGRYIDSAGLFLAAWPLAFLLAALTRQARGTKAL